MAENRRPHPSMSLKSAFTNKSRYVGNTDERLLERPSKSTLVQFHITNEDISRSTTATAPGTPQETRRDTWPIPRQSRRPGTYSFDVAPTLVKTPWELERSKRYSRTPDRRPLKTRKFQQLPREIVVSILDQLKSLHCSGCTLNVTSYQNDLRALCTINRGWHRLAREHLYQEIWLPRNEEQNKSNIPFRKHGSRLKLLLRTLEESPGISNMVHHLRVTAKLADELEGEAWLTGPISKSSALRVLRDIIFKCRNLERLCGYAPMRLDSNIEIFDALSSCHRLKSHTWRLPPARAYPGCELRSSDLLRCHTSWHQLETLVIWQSIGEFLPNLHNSAVPNGLDGRYPGAMPIAGYEMWQRQQHGCGLGIGIITAVAQRLTSLKHLALGCLSPTDFHNGTLLTSPPLKSLRLEEVHGVTDQGIDQLVHSRLAMSLERLVLVGLELTSLQSLQSLFTNLTRLCSFSLVQDTSPEIPHPLSETNNYFSLASATMRYLHWDVLTRGTSTVIVANSIAAGKFPNLRTVKVPCDDDGAIQNLCRPIALEPITGQDMATLEEWECLSTYQRSLRVSQIQAQVRLRRARKEPSLKVVIQDEDEATKHTHVIGSYLGNLASDIEYSLDPAIEGTGSAIACIEDVLIHGRLQGKGKLGKGVEAMLDLDVLF